MRGLGSQTLAIAFGVACLAGRGAYAEVIDFEPAAYSPEHTLVGADGWLMSTGDVSSKEDNFKIQSVAGQGKWVHALSTTTTAVYRSFSPGSTNGNLIDIRWKWRALSDSAHICVGAANGAGNVRVANRAAVCLEPNGVVSAQGLGLTPTSSNDTWKPNTWHYMHMVLDLGAGTTGRFAVYMGEDSLRGAERLVQAATAMGGSGAVTRISLRDEGGGGYVDIDDLSWEPMALWQAASDADSVWSFGKNWSTGTVPDSNTHVLFAEGSTRGCMLDKNSVVRSITVAAAFKGNLNLGQQVLSVLGRADFTGGNYPFSAPGHIRFPSAHGSSLTGPEGVKVLATVRHDGPGLLRLDTRNLAVANLTQTAGVFDFNGFDLAVGGDLVVKGGQPGTLRNLDGRAIVVVGNAKLEGASKDTLLGLSTPSKIWRINVSGDTLAARFAVVGNGTASNRLGNAVQSSDAGSNVGWNFVTGPAITLQPQSVQIKVGESATFKVQATGKPLAFQWLRNDQDIQGPAGKDSIYSVTGARKADSGAVFSCRVSNAVGSVNSAPATLKVAFPAPGVLPTPQTISDSLFVQLTTPAAGCRMFYSRNGGPYQEYLGTFVLRDSTLLRAFATLNGDTSGAGSWIFPKTSLPQVPEAIISPEPTSFTTSLTVTMAAPVAGSVVYYTLDNSDPDSTKTRYTAPIVLVHSTTVRAIAIKPGYAPSPIHTHIYSKTDDGTLSRPTANPPGGSFSDSVVVHLFPPTDAPDAVVYYLLGDSGPFKYSDSLVLRVSVTLKALAVLDTRISETVQWEFSRRMAAPSASPKGRSFPDTLRVALASAIEGAIIHYTLDGTEPSAASPGYAGALILDSSVTLKAAAVKDGVVGAVSTDIYTLIPDTPFVSHRGGDYSSRITISLKASTPRATIYYTLDGTAPGPENPTSAYAAPFNLDVSATLKAVAIAGQGAKTQRSALRIENYTFITPGKRVLNPGQRLDLSGNYNLVSPLAGASPVNVEVIAADTIARTLSGFRDILFGIRVSLPDDAVAFPKVMFNAPTGEPRSLYQITAPNTVRFLTSSDTAALTAPGTYFLAVDSAAPIIRFVSENFTDSDSTRLVVSIEDNVSNLLLDLERSDSKSANFTGHEISPILILAVNARNPAGTFLPLTVRIRVNDHSRATTFPSDGGFYGLAQKFSGPVRTPAAFHIGEHPSDLWDLISIPLATDKPLTLSQLRKNNLAPGLQGAAVTPATGLYHYLGDEDPILPGSGVWLASTASIPSLLFPSLQTQGHKGAGPYKLTLHPGWNQVANPTLARLWWPVSRAFPAAYETSPLKGLHGYDGVVGDFVHSDTLLPWRGYFAYYKGGRDTVIELRDGPVIEAAPPAKAKSAASAGAGFSLRLALPTGLSLRLGASPRAVDGIGWEDEQRPPSRAGNARLFSARAGQRLETDMARWAPGTVYAWKVVAGLPALASALGNPNVTPAFSASAVGGLPKGYAAWAVSRSRGLRFPISASPATASDAPGSGIPWHPGFIDTLEVLAGPEAELASRLADIPVHAGPFAARLAAHRGGYALNLDLPAAAHVRLTVVALDGRTVESRALDLPEGRYHLEGGNGGRGIAPGLYALLIEAQSSSTAPRIPARTALKFAIP